MLWPSVECNLNSQQLSAFVSNGFFLLESQFYCSITIIIIIIIHRFSGCTGAFCLSYNRIYINTSIYMNVEYNNAFSRCHQHTIGISNRIPSNINSFALCKLWMKPHNEHMHAHVLQDHGTLMMMMMSMMTIWIITITMMLAWNNNNNMRALYIYKWLFLAENLRF